MSANPLKGEIDLVVGDRTYILRPTTNTLAAMEKATGLAYGELLNRLPSIDLTHLRALLFYLLQPCHGKEVKTLEQAGAIMDDAGGHHGVFPVIIEMLALNRPPREAKKGADRGDANPPGAQDGTGDGSFSTPDAPA